MSNNAQAVIARQEWLCIWILFQQSEAFQPHVNQRPNCLPIYAQAKLTKYGSSYIGPMENLATLNEHELAKTKMERAKISHNASIAAIFPIAQTIVGAMCWNRLHGLTIQLSIQLSLTTCMLSAVNPNYGMQFVWVIERALPPGEQQN